MPHRTRPVLLGLWLGPCLAGALGSAGCVPDGALLSRPYQPRTPSKAKAQGPRTDAQGAAQPGQPARPSPAAASEVELAAAEPEVARLFPGADPAGSARGRRPVAVLLFAPPETLGPEPGLARVEGLRLQPVACSVRGKLAFGHRCGEVMPAHAKVRLTQSGDAAPAELEVERSIVPFRDEAGNHTWLPPYAPACCMYNTCVGRTLPYFPRSQPGTFWAATRTVLAVWPPDAEIDLQVHAPGRAEGVKLDDGPWTQGGAGPAQLFAAFALGNRRFASVNGGQGRSDAGLFADTGGGWQRVLTQTGVRAFYPLASTDLDGDGRPELLVYERWANDYGLEVVAGEPPKPLYRFSCGNI
ncbi:MAG: hypothetical protein U1A78_31530 [Polyangia bacterium]